MTSGYRPELIQSAFMHFISARVQPFWSLTTPRLRLIARQVLSEELVALQFETNAAFRRQAADWQGGQYVTISTVMDGVYHQRSYSLLGLPKQPAWQSGSDTDTITPRAHSISIAVKPQGMVSDYLTQHARLGTVLDTALPSGTFTLQQTLTEPSTAPSTPLLFIAGGSGITPMLGLIAQALALGYSVTLLHYQRTLVLEPHWAQLRRQYPAFTYHLIDTKDASTYLANTRHLSTASLQALNLPLAITRIFACGSPALLAGLYRAADGVTLPQDQALRDRITIEQFDSSTVDGQQGHEPITAEKTIYLRSRQRSFVSSSTLLTAATQAGIRLPHGCRQGICHMCRCNKISGVVKNIQTGKLSHDGHEPIQTCITVAMTDVVLDV